MDAYNPQWEGVARQIQISLRKTGGPALERMVYDTKVKNGETILTHIHHKLRMINAPVEISQIIHLGDREVQSFLHRWIVGAMLPRR